ncbi:hypothetical protein Esti_002404 [Eimeria stiedai]
MSSVKVAVRVRPFNDRENNMNAELCISMEGKTTTITNQDDAKNPTRTFAFDYSYWSHDGFQVEDSGYCSPLSTKYADQQRVYEDVGKDVLNNSFEGYNACLFAYGQTGAGKSYSMVGYGANKGIIVRACEEIFQRIEQNTDPTVRAEVQVSMLEIYNEQVQDLLQPMEKRPKGGLKIRHTPQLGTFVQDLSKCPVDSYAAIQNKLDEGTANRTVGATLMNATSSRAHTVLQIGFRQVTIDTSTGEPVSQKYSEISLVDLAGSERAGSTGATGDRLKEGCAINQSLSALGNVISALADKAAGKLKPGQVVPYRDSALTRILQTALGGNSKTCMIAALSPASVNYEETLSTLRYADRVKQIKNEAVVNENPLEKLIRELREENERLKKAMGGTLPSPSGGNEPDPGLLDAIRKQYEEEIEANKRAMEEMTTSWKQKIEEEKKRAAAAGKSEDHVELTVPTLQNLNEDPFLTCKIICAIKEGICTFGKPEGEDNPTFRIGGLGVIASHASAYCKKIQNDAEDPEDISYCVTLNNLYVYVDPLDMDKALPSWEDAMKEVKKDQVNAYGQPQLTEDEKEKALRLQEMLKEVESGLKKLEDERQELLKKLDDKEKELLASGAAQEVIQEQMRLLQEERQEAERELQRKQEELQARELRIKKEQVEEDLRREEERAARIVLEDLMTRTSLLVDEANMIAQELCVGAFFSPKLTVRSDPMGGTSRATLGSTVMQRSEIMIRVDRMDSDLTQLWPLDLFERKVFEMREIYANWAPQLGEALKLPDDVSDPFAPDPESYQVLGQAYVYLETIRNLLPIENESFPIFDSKGQKQGTLVISVDIRVGPAKTETDGEDDLMARRIEDLDDFDSVEDVRGRELTITVTIHSACNLPAKSCRHPQVLYRWVDGMTEVSAVSLDEGSRDVVFKSTREFLLNANEIAFEWLSGVLVFEVSGKFVSKSGRGRGEKEKEISRLEGELEAKKALLEKIEAALRMQGESLDALLGKTAIGDEQHTPVNAEELASMGMRKGGHLKQEGAEIEQAQPMPGSFGTVEPGPGASVDDEKRLGFVAEDIPLKIATEQGSTDRPIALDVSNKTGEDSGDPDDGNAAAVVPEASERQSNTAIHEETQRQSYKQAIVEERASVVQSTSSVVAGAINPETLTRLVGGVEEGGVPESLIAPLAALHLNKEKCFLIVRISTEVLLLAAHYLENQGEYRACDNLHEVEVIRYSKGSTTISRSKSLEGPFYAVLAGSKLEEPLERTGFLSIECSTALGLRLLLLVSVKGR